MGRCSGTSRSTSRGPISRADCHVTIVVRVARPTMIRDITRRWGNDKTTFAWATAHGTDLLFHANDADFPNCCGHN